MNKDKLKNIISKKANGNSGLAAQLYQMYFFEHILERISKSQYKHNIILKGGLLLASVIGNDERTTKDMDATLKSLPLEKDSIKNIMNEILNIELDDGISYEIVDIKDIREDSEYGGFKINILAKMSTLKVYIFVELTTGDKITPREIEYNYNCIFEDKHIPILAYTLETVIAEKYHAIIERKEYSTRMKDFYDIYILIKNNKEKIDLNTLKTAIKNTFNQRKNELNITTIITDLENLKKSERLINNWRSYQQSAPYSSNIQFEELFESLEYLTGILN